MSNHPKPAEAHGSDDETVLTAAVVPGVATLSEADGESKVETRPRAAKSPARRTLDLGDGMVVGHYVIESTLGSGGCGKVYAARHMDTGERVALKVLRAEVAHLPSVVERFAREIEALNRINHENIVRVSDVGEVSPGIPYYAMEHLEGVTLRQLLAQHQRLSPREALALLEPVAAALHRAHEQGVIHRDIKASNVFISEVGGKRVVKLLDFGIAKLLYGDYKGDGLTAPGAVIGTPHAMSPEQIRCEALDCRTDIYSLGALIFLLVTGGYPFQNPNTHALTLMHLQTPPPRPSELANVPAALDEVVLKCLAKAPAARYSTVPELMAALRRAVGDDAPTDEGARRSVSAVGIRLEVCARGDRELDDEMIEDMAGMLDLVESELTQHGFDFPLRASNALTAVRFVEGTDGAHFSLDDARAIVDSIRASLDERDGAHPDVHVSLCVREDFVVCRDNTERVELLGGPLLDTETWLSA